MYILAIETTGFFCSVAIIDNEGKIFFKESKNRFNHLKELTPMIRDVLFARKISLDDINSIAVSCGPGSFTGIRIGVSTARAIAQARDIPCILVPTIFAFAMREYVGISQLVAEANTGVSVFTVDQAKAKIKDDTNETQNKTKDKPKNGSIKIACPVFDARRKQVYAGAYTDDVELVKADAYKLEEFIGRLVKELDLFLKNEMKSGLSGGENQRIILQFKGDGVASYKDGISELIDEYIYSEKEKDVDINKKIKYDFKEECQDAIGVALMGRKFHKSGQVERYSKVLPIYMRKPEAERNLEARLKEKSKKEK